MEPEGVLPHFQELYTHPYPEPDQSSHYPSPPSSKQTNSVAFSPQVNYTDWETTTYWRNLVPTFADRGVSRGQHGGSPTVINLSFLDWSHYFSFK
jgi:hypothetical protein